MHMVSKNVGCLSMNGIWVVIRTRWTWCVKNHADFVVGFLSIYIMVNLTFNTVLKSLFLNYLVMFDNGENSYLFANSSYSPVPNCRGSVIAWGVGVVCGGCVVLLLEIHKMGCHNKRGEMVKRKITFNRGWTIKWGGGGVVMYDSRKLVC